ncbi:MAG: hypothetical protein ACLSUW_02790 [Akkermansia sp.]
MKRSLPPRWRRPEILPAQFGTEAGILGSAHLALNTAGHSGLISCLHPKYSDSPAN